MSMLRHLDIGYKFYTNHFTTNQLINLRNELDEIIRIRENEGLDKFLKDFKKEHYIGKIFLQKTYYEYESAVKEYFKIYDIDENNNVTSGLGITYNPVTKYFQISKITNNEYSIEVFRDQYHIEPIYDIDKKLLSMIKSYEDNYEKT